MKMAEIEFLLQVASSEIFISLISNQCKKRVPITWIWNQVMNFGATSWYPVLATNHYLIHNSVQKCMSVKIGKLFVFLVNLA